MFSKLCRVGTEPTVRYTPNGTAVMNLSLAYNYGQKDSDNKRPTQWIEATLWGKQAESLQPYINKRDQVSVSLDDLHIETYESRNGQGHKLVGRVVGFDFVGNRKESEPEQSNKHSEPNNTGSGYSDIDEVPF